MHTEFTSEDNSYEVHAISDFFSHHFRQRSLTETRNIPLSD